MKPQQGDNASVVRALKALLEIGRSKAGLSVSALAREIQVDKSTVSRLLATMAGLDFVRRDKQNSEYKLGPALLVLGRMARSQYDLRLQIADALAQLCDLTNECAHAAVLSENGALYVEQAQPDRPFVLDAPVGTVAPLHCTALGKALLAGLPADECNTILATLELKKFTPLTITDSEKLFLELERSRLSGVSRDEEEYTIGVRCLAAPVFKASGALVCAIGVSGPTPRLTDDIVKACTFVVKEIATKLSSDLGYNQFENERTRAAKLGSLR